MPLDRVIIDEDRCKSCGICVSVCPRGIIVLSDRVNKYGFRPAMVKEQEQCTSCTLCGRMCPHVAIEVCK